MRIAIDGRQADDGARHSLIGKLDTTTRTIDCLSSNEAVLVTLHGTVNKNDLWRHSIPLDFGPLNQIIHTVAEGS